MTSDPEERAWYKLGERLGIPVEELKDRIPVSEFLSWIHILNEEWYEPTLTHYHLAQIAHQVYLLRCSLPFTGQKPKADFDSFLHMFKKKKVKDTPRKLLDRPLKKTPSGKVIDPEWQKRIDRTRSAMNALLGLKIKDDGTVEHTRKPTRRKPPRKK